MYQTNLIKLEEEIMREKNHLLVYIEVGIFFTICDIDYSLISTILLFTLGTSHRTWRIHLQRCHKPLINAHRNKIQAE